MIAEALQKALDHAGNTHSLADVAQRIADGDAHLFVGDQSALVVEIHDFPRRKVMQVWLAGGDMREILTDLKPRAEAWAKEQGCDRILIIGRPGWERTLAEDGYRPIARVIAKELTP